MTIFVYKRLTRNSEIRNTVLVFPNIWSWGKLEIPNLAQISVKKFIESFKMARLQLLPFFTIFELLGENQQGVAKTLPHTHTHTHTHTPKHT